MEYQTKASINLKEGIIELEGSEEFVKEQLEKFSDLINNNYENQVQDNKKIKKDKHLDRDTTQSNHSNDKYLAHFGVEKEKLDEIIYSDNSGEFKIITHNIVGSNAEKQEQLTLLYCLTKSFYSDEPVESSEIRNLCEQYARLDTKNFSTYLKSKSNYFIISGEKGSHNKQVEITVPGEKAARELIQELISEE